MTGKISLVKNPFLWIILFSIPALWALFVPGFYGASDDLHIAWLHQMDKVLRMGQIPPRYVPDLSFGFGYPLFNFVFPLPFYLAEIFHLLSFSLVDSIKAVFFLSIPLSAIFMYLLLKEFTNNLLSFLGAILYIYTPYRAVDIYIRGAIGEIVSFALLPLIVLSFVKIFKGNSYRWVGIGAVALASLVLSHNITAYMFFAAILLLIIVLLFFNEPKKEFIRKVFLTVFLSLLIGSYFWLPAILESSLLKYDTVFNFADHFPTIKQLFTPYWGYGASVPGPYDGMSFFLGTVNIFILIMAIPLTAIYWKKFEKLEKALIFWSLLGILTAIFMMNYRSSFIWSSLPLLPYFQFPWRFLTLTTFLIPLLVISFKYTNFKKGTYFVLIMAAVLISANYFRPQDFLGRTDDYYINRYIPIPKASDEYRQTQEEYLRLPKISQKRPDENYPILFSANHPVADVFKINDLNFTTSIYSDKQIQVNINKYFFPGWQAKLDGKDIAIKPAPPFGQISIQIPKGVHKLKVYFAETKFRQGLNMVSFTALLFALFLIFKKRIRII